MPGSNCTCESSTSSTTINQVGSSSDGTGLGFWVSVGYNIISTVIAAGLTLYISRSKSSATHSIESTNIEVKNPDGSTRVERTVKAKVAADTEHSTTEFRLNPSKAGGSSKPDSGSGVEVATPADAAGMPKTPALKGRAIGLAIGLAQEVTHGEKPEGRSSALTSLAKVVADPAHLAAASIFQDAAMRSSQGEHPDSQQGKQFHKVARHAVDLLQAGRVLDDVKAGVDNTPHVAVADEAPPSTGAAKVDAAHAAEPALDHVALAIRTPDHPEVAAVPHEANARKHSIIEGAGALLRTTATPLAAAAAHAIDGMPFGQAAGAMIAAAAKAVSGAREQTRELAQTATSGVGEAESHGISRAAHVAEVTAHTGLTEGEEAVSVAQEHIGVVGEHGEAGRYFDV